MKSWAHDRGLFRVVVGAFLLVGSFAHGAIQPGRKLNFREALQLAFEKSPVLIAALSELKIREAEFSNSKSVFLPSLDLSTVHGWRDSEPPIGTSRFVNELSLSVTENLYDNGISFARYESSRYQREIAELNFKNERERLVLQIANEYMRYSLAVNLAEVQEQQFNIINKQYQSVNSQFQQGVRTRRDFLRFKAELRRSEIALQNSRSNRERSYFELLRLLGFEINVETPKYELEPIGIDIKLVQNIPTQSPDLSQHFQYRMADLRRKVLEKDVYVVRRDYWPQVFVSAGATYQMNDYLRTGEAGPQDETTSWNALLTLKLNLWDWGIRRRDILIAEARKSQTESYIQTDLNRFSSENAKMMLDLDQSSKNFALARELLDLETKTHHFLETEYRNGKVSYLDIIVGLRDLLNAKVQMSSSYFDLRTQLLLYRYHEGKLYESIIEK